ncbi:hypothetical protein AYI70_g157 [Smittium culicis]|uniref:Uncharacterized protein n=1 Tax=Smittium culicis TaxID=133412 RepID=A0A1R1YHQ2_9FUNG|nr:hypothetical protein AYI70_g157 [Smittium culicis]
MDARLSLPRRSSDNGENEGGVYDVEISHELYYEIPINVDYTAAGSPYGSSTSRTKESITVYFEIMNIDSHTEETCHSEPIVLEEQTDFMEQALILARDARIGNLHRFQRYSLGNSGAIPNVLRNMKSKRGENSHKRQGITHSTVRHQTQECDRSISVSLFRKHKHTCVRKEIRRNNFLQTTQDSKTDLESLSGNEYQTSGHQCTVGAQFRRCAEQTDCANRMVSNTGGIQSTEFGLWSTRRRPVPRHQVIRPEYTDIELVRVQQPIQLPIMEPGLPSSSESPTRTINNNSGDTNEEVCYLVSGPIVPVNLTAGPSSSNDNHSGSKKRKRRFLESQGLGTYAVDWLLSNKRLAGHDISPVLDLSKEWGPSTECSIKKLTAKICLLLSITGFLKASDIHRIDDERSHVSLGVLNLVIIAPKEKRSGRPIEKPCQISPHNDPILCPVIAYSVYKEKVATSLCPTPHANNSK